MECVRNADVVVGPVGSLRDHDVGGDPSDIGLKCERQQIEHQLHLGGEVFQFTYRSIGDLQTAQVLRCGLLGAPLDLANAFQISVQSDSVARSEFALQLLGAVEHQVENAVRLP